MIRNDKQWKWHVTQQHLKLFRVQQYAHDKVTKRQGINISKAYYLNNMLYKERKNLVEIWSSFKIRTYKISAIETNQNSNESRGN
jgi:hypothetical protein